MERDEQDIFARAYSRLRGLRDNLDKLSRVEETYVNEYHSILDTLEKINIDTTDFRIPSSELQRRITMSSPLGDRYSDEKYVGKVLLLAKLDAILVYFQFITSDKPRKIGFISPNKS